MAISHLCGTYASCTNNEPEIHLKCTRCSEIKPLVEFRQDKRTKTGRTRVCKACLNAKATEVHNKRYKEDPTYKALVNARTASYRNTHKDEEDFKAKAKVRNKLSYERSKQNPEFMERKRETSSAWYENNKDTPEYRARFSDPVFMEKFNAGQIIRYHKNKLKIKAKKYGTTVDQIEKDLEACKGKCPILGLPFESCGGWVVDHCHVTGVYRGVISNDANLAAAFLHDSMESALRISTYLGRNVLFSSAKTA